MKTYLMVALGGAIGTVGRFWIAAVVARLVGDTFPWGTLLINVTGSFVIGFFAVLTAPDGRVLVGTTARQFVTVGICGGYTTFSAFSLQTLDLLNAGKTAYALAYIAASVLLCLLAVWLGAVLAAMLNAMKGA